MTDVTRNTRGLTVKCWNNHALRIFVATLGKMPRFLAFFLLLGSSSSQPSVPSPLPTLALLASPAKRKKITQNYYDDYWILSNFHGKCESSSILHYGKCIVKCSRGGKFLLHTTTRSINYEWDFSNCKRILQGEGVKSRVLQFGATKKVLAASFWGGSTPLRKKS